MAEKQLPRSKAERTKSMTGIELIAEERYDQIRKGWSEKHDDGHTHGELAQVAAIVAANGTDLEIDHDEDDWNIIRKHANDRVHQLAIAGALIAAEIDRLTRLNTRS